jgi:hypothetical protein
MQMSNASAITVRTRPVRTKSFAAKVSVPYAPHLGFASATALAFRNASFAGMLMITTVQTANIWNVGIKTAAAQNMVAIGFIEKTLHKSITWLEWFIRRGAIWHSDDDRTLLHDDHDDASRGERNSRRPRTDPQVCSDDVSLRPPGFRRFHV